MKRRNQFWIYPLLIGTFLVLKTSCTKEEDNPTNGRTTAVFNPNLAYGSMTDQDGNVYKTITIGSQTWMAENLRTTRYRNGEVISDVTDGTAWFNLSSGAYCNYNNTKNIDTIATFGRLYNWFAVNDVRNIAPSGWHVPTYDEWMILENYLGGDSIAGGNLKETGLSHWKKPNRGATNETGFTALPGGVRIKQYYSIGEFAYMWTATESVIIEDGITYDFAWHRDMSSFYSNLGRCDCPKRDAYSLRCVKD